MGPSYSRLVMLSVLIVNGGPTPPPVKLSTAIEITTHDHQGSREADGVRRGTLSAAAAARPGVLQLARPRLKKGAVKWVAPLTADGHPDLQGVWMNDSATPLERPKGLEGRALLSDAEVAELQRRADRIFGSDDNDAGLGDNVFLAAFANVDRYKFAAATGWALEAERRVF